MSDKTEGQVEIDGAAINVTGNRGERVHVGPGGIHVRDGDSEVKVTWTGIRVRDATTRVDISVWKPLVGCAIGLVVLVAVLTVVVVSIVKLML
jgi:hypothetical protein